MKQSQTQHKSLWYKINHIHLYNIWEQKQNTGVICPSLLLCKFFEQVGMPVSKMLCQVGRFALFCNISNSWFRDVCWLALTVNDVSLIIPYLTLCVYFGNKLWAIEKNTYNCSHGSFITMIAGELLRGKNNLARTQCDVEAERCPHFSLLSITRNYSYHSSSTGTTKMRNHIIPFL